ncbi:type II secretion system protein E (GspE) [Thermosyntropha lipolytica DSM 11003]|uniref:Type II secretion system protein E (GspE) n=1 Tax=Thermosyntropha lipolytica DSM 11003 TaxID=1123382 RepID=A0A1M5LNC1_9FIRM|nr:ATPase, T2SS/T4P/T4SS family [Thermosyntropha lipolytica]SHG66410.1 type II secretion system protein E (GspE) [Thermosyntropha lipolytica DSM 11003]
MGRTKKMGEMLVDMGLITQEQLAEALEEQKVTGERLGKILIDKGFITENQLLETLEFMLGIPHVQLSRMQIDPEAVKLVPPNIIRKYKILPIKKTAGSIMLAMADPLNQQAVDDARMASGFDIIPVLASERELEGTIRQYLAFQMDPGMEKILSELKETGRPLRRENQNIIRIEDEAPIIRMVNAILNQAVQGRCSDIHLEPQEGDMRVRFRVDGELYEVLHIPKASEPAVVSRLKIMAGMDIAEKRVPQDGRFSLNIEGREIDFRASTLPTAYGEKVVLRILDRASALNRIEQLGLTPQNQERLLRLAKRPHGMLIVTGPTGSGKTSTLYALLNEINSIDKNIITLEDPVEYTLAGINQVQINVKAGLTFASGLRSVLRQDPDIIMVGEIRDNETAELAVKAALTGHLVLSTLHTNSAAGTVARLLDMGIEGFLLSSSLIGIVSQRLVRKLCTNCRQPYILEKEMAEHLGIPEEAGEKFYRPTGCHMCRQIGYQGRTAVHEIMPVDAGIKKLISRGEVSEEQIEAEAVREGMITIKMDGILKAKKGITSLEEVMKVVYLGG